MPFDPDAPAAPGSGIFGLPFTEAESRVVLIPVPWDATTSYRRGTIDGPAAILAASQQVDLLDRRFGRIYERGIHMLDESERIRALSEEVGELTRRFIDAGATAGSDSETSTLLGRVDAASEEVNEHVYARARSVLAAGKVPGVVGGEHSVPFAAIRACAEHHGSIGLLHIDAHMDLRMAFEGFVWSHASIMFNVLSRVPGVVKLVQVGIRDMGERERDFAAAQGGRVEVHYDDLWAEELANGVPFATLARRAIEALPELVYVSFDIDGLDPSNCPHTGTPVPGGLSFNHAALLLAALRESGKRVVGFDLVEVAPGAADAPEWDANVGARLLYKLCGLA